MPADPTPNLTPDSIADPTRDPTRDPTPDPTRDPTPDQTADPTRRRPRMPDFTRRQFLRRASIGAAATGVIAAGGAGLFEAVGAAGATSLATGASSTSPTLEGSDIFAHVVDARTGLMTIFVGTKAVSYQNQDLAQTLLRAAQ